jgi:long-chain acyl-CoA synthetase
MNTPHPWLAHYPAAINWHAPIIPSTIPALLQAAAESYPTHIALDFKGKLYSYAELWEKVQRFAQGLQAIGMTQGMHVGLFMPNCPQFVIAYYGVLLAGGVVVNYNPLYAPAEVAYQCEDSRTDIMITLNIAMLYEKVAPLLSSGALKKLVIGDLASVLPKAKGAIYKLLKWKELSHIPEDEKHHRFMELLSHPPLTHTPTIDPTSTLAVLQYTGGTTGTPKGVMLTHANLSANAQMCHRWFFEARAGQETIMAALPFFHVFAMTAVMNYGLSQGFRLIMHPRFDLKALLHDIHHKHPTIMAGVPTMFTAMLNYKHLSRYTLTSLKMCISGGAALPCEIKQRFEEATGCVLVEGYGLSESSPVVACNPLVGINKAGSIGLPFPQTTIEIVDKESGEEVLPLGEIGEICIKGVQVMQGYWHRPSETAEVLRGEWLHTGDIGYMDEEGYVYVVDRKKEMIISGGYNIYPRHIEEELYTHPDVVECAVIGIPHPVRGEVPKAFIVLRAGASVTTEELRTYIRERVAAYSVPHAYAFVDSLPKSMIGKILKKELR